MSEGGKWTPGKIFLLIVGILAGLGILCCGAGWFVAGDKIMSGVHFGSDSAAFIERLQTDFGKTALFGIDKTDQLELVLTIGVDEELTPERVIEIQDSAWKSVGATFGRHGFFPVKYVAVGRPVKGGGGGQGAVIDWMKNMATVEEVVARTGVPAPPNVKFLPEEMDGRTMKITVGSGGEDEPDAEPKPADDGAPKDQEGGGAEPGGK